MRILMMSKHHPTMLYWMTSLRNHSDPSRRGSCYVPNEEIALTWRGKRYVLVWYPRPILINVRLIEQYGNNPEELDINCVDPLNRSALVAAIENENIELIRLLLEANIEVKVSMFRLQPLRESDSFVLWRMLCFMPLKRSTWKLWNCCFLGKKTIMCLGNHT